MKSGRRLLALAVIAGGLAVAGAAAHLAGLEMNQVYWFMNRITGDTVSTADVLQRVGPRVEPVWRSRFAEAAFPPDKISLLAFKDEARLEVWAAGADSAWKRIGAYPVLGQSGGPGPKLREGDLQVPEGVYRVAALNPMSRFHLSLGLNYPNEFDLARAEEEGRDDPGSDIYIHGGRASVGCLAMGDPAIEELFWLVATVGKENVDVVIAPNDARDGGTFIAPEDAPAWISEVHEAIRDTWRELGAL